MFVLGAIPSPPAQFVRKKISRLQRDTLPVILKHAAIELSFQLWVSCQLQRTRRRSPFPLVVDVVSWRFDLPNREGWSWAGPNSAVAHVEDARASEQTALDPWLAVPPPSCCIADLDDRRMTGRNPRPSRWVGDAL